MAYIIVNAPTLPKYMSIIITHFEKKCKDGVIPNVRPTVPIADAVSKRHVSKGRPSLMLMAMPDRTNSKIYIVNIVDAVRTVSADIRLLNAVTSSFLRNTAIQVIIRTAKVVVFIPPAVEPDVPPISIKIMVMS